MRRLLLFIVVLVLGVSATSFAQSSDQRSLGDVARESRNTPKKSSAHVYTDESFSKPDSPEAKGKADAKEQDAVEADEDGLNSEDGDAPRPKAKPAAKAEPKAHQDNAENKPQEIDRAQLASEWKSRIAAQRGAIELLEREMSVMEREYKLRASSYYADAGLRLRDDRRWQDDEKKYNAELDAKKQKLAKAREDLSQMVDQARKAGVNGVE